MTRFNVVVGCAVPLVGSAVCRQGLRLFRIRTNLVAAELEGRLLWPRAIGARKSGKEVRLSPDFRPVSSIFTLMSSFGSGQWRCLPPAMICQVPRSSGVAWSSRGYQASGTAILRPSDSLACSVSSPNCSSVAPGTSKLVVEIAMPGLHRSVVKLWALASVKYCRPQTWRLGAGPVLKDSCTNPPRGAA